MAKALILTDSGPSIVDAIPTINGTLAGIVRNAKACCGKSMPLKEYVQ